MAKSKKSPARKPANRPTPRPPAPLVNSLPPQILEEAAQGWLKSSGATSLDPIRPQSSASPRESLGQNLDAELRSLRKEIAALGDRVSRLEGRSS